MHNAMTAPIIQQLVKQEWQDPDTGQEVMLPIKEIVIASGIIQDADQYLKALNLGTSIAIVSDEQTFIAAGHMVEKSCQSFQKVENIVLPDGVKPDVEVVHSLQNRVRNADLIVAVGSGTINDICKYTSFLLDKPYVVFATAPSMNGYASSSASMIVKGYKGSLAAHMPVGIYVDIDIMAKAPRRLIQSGIGDSLCRSTCQVDWYLSHLILKTPYRGGLFEMLQEHEQALYDSALGMVEGDQESIYHLSTLLILSGVSMYLAGGSYPASQGEHMIAHTMEMAFGDRLQPTYHGEQIGVTTLTMAKIQEKILATTPKLTYKPLDEEGILHFFGSSVGQSCLAEAAKKQFSEEQAEELNALIQQEWPSWQAQLQSFVVPHDQIYKVLTDIKAPHTEVDLGWPMADYQDAIRYAKFTRDRFTALDLV